MAAVTGAHGVSTAGDSVVSFVSADANKKQIKNLKRWKPFVKVSYDSGSDADVESDEEQTKKRKAPTKTRKTPTRKKQKVAKQKPPPASSDKPGSDVKIKDSEPVDDDNSGDDGEDVARVPGAGWADVMAKILQRGAPAEAETVLLAKSKDYEKAKKKEQEEYAERRKEKETKDEWEHLGRSKPRVTDREIERKLQRIATRGVVQLFNAVKKQQKRFEDKMETAKSEKKRAEVQASVKKGDFLDLLKATPVITKKNTNKNKVDGNADSKKPSWSVLQDDFMMGGTMKDWDKKNDSDDSDILDDGDSNGNAMSDSD